VTVELIQRMNSMREKTVLITGATSGIGYEAALELAKRGARIIFNSRDMEKGEKIQQKLIDKSGNNHIHVFPCDLGSLHQVKVFAHRVLDQFDRLDVLINNAGVLHESYTTTQDGLEATFAINHLAHFLLTTLLTDRLLEREHARIVNVSSASHKGSKIHFDDLQLKDKYWMMRAYGQSKLAMILFTRSLSEKYASQGLIANAMHPGVINTGIIRNTNYILQFFFWLISRSPRQGAQTIIYLAADPEVSDISGEYFVNKRVQRASSEAYNPETADRLWEMSEQMIREVLD